MEPESNFTMIRRRTSEVIQNAQHNLPALPAMPALSGLPKFPQIPNVQLPQFSNYVPFNKEYPIKGTWERIYVPPVPRSSHSLDIVDGSAYIFGGEGPPRDPVNSDMHVIKLPYSSAGADYYRIKPIPVQPDVEETVEKTSEPATSEVVEGTSAKEEGENLDEVSLKDGEDAAEEKPAQEEQEEEAEEEGQPKNKGKEKAKDDIPPPRVGHASATIGTRIFIFGGHGGPEEKPLEEAGRVWVFDTRTRRWTYLDPVPAVKGGTIIPHPAPRSFHCATATDRPQDFPQPKSAQPTTWQQRLIGDTSKTGIPQDPIVGNVAEEAVDQEAEGYGTFFVHGGSLANGDRTNDLWAFDVHSRTWKELPTAPGPARTGSAICISKSRLFRFGGFDGDKELGGQLDFIQLEVGTFDDKASKGEVAIHAHGSWQTIYQNNPDASSTAIPNEPVQAWPSNRSVVSFHALNFAGGREYLVLSFGESNPDSEGHASSSSFHNDAWVFQAPPLGMTTGSITDAMLQAVGRKTGEGKWTKIGTLPYDPEVSEEVPSPRGWQASAVMTELEESAIVFWGGADEDNEWIGDGWILRVGY